MKYKDLDKEYYVMSTDGANNHPLLDWGSTNFNFILENTPVGEKSLDFPLSIIFSQPYPVKYEMADLLMLSTNLCASEKLKTLFNTIKIYGIQFIPIEIESNTGEIIKNHFAIHIWNKIPAIDKNNYEGGKPNRFGNILDLHKFSLDDNLLKNIPFENRLIFELSENSTISIVHQDLYKSILDANLTGFSFYRIDEWDNNTMFR